MGLNTTNSLAVAFNKLSGKVHTQQNFAVSEEGISTNVQMSYSTVFGEPIVKLPVTSSGLTALYSTNGVVQRVKFEIDIIPDTQIAVGRSQGYRLKLPADWNASGALYPEFVAGTYLNTALGKLQIVPPLYGTLKLDGSTEYDPILYQTNGSTVIAKFDPINWYLDLYSGVIFIQDPPSGYDSNAARPGYLEAFLYVGNYVDNVITNNIVTVSNGLSKVNNDIRLGGLVTGNTVIGVDSSDFIISGNTGSMFIQTDDPSAQVGLLKNPNGISTGFVIGVTDQAFINAREISLLPLTGSSLILTEDGSVSVTSLNTLSFGSGTGGTVFNNLGNILLNFGETGYTLQYDEDRSPYYNLRSVPDVEFVTNLVTGFTSSGLTANNGLIKIGSNVRLGGILTGNTTIQGNDKNLFLGTSLSKIGNFDLRAGNNVTFETVSTLTNKVSYITLTPNDLNISSWNAGLSHISSVELLPKNIIIRNDIASSTNELSVSNTGITYSNSSGGSYHIGATIKRTVTGATTLTIRDHIVLITTNISSYTINVPSNPINGQTLKFKDISGNALTNNITISGNGKNIDGSSTASLNTNYGCFEICYDSNNNGWFILSSVS